MLAAASAGGGGGGGSGGGADRWLIVCCCACLCLILTGVGTYHFTYFEKDSVDCMFNGSSTQIKEDRTTLADCTLHFCAKLNQSADPYAACKRNATSYEDVFCDCGKQACVCGSNHRTWIVVGIVMWSLVGCVFVTAATCVAVYFGHKMWRRSGRRCCA
jgi:hypothetical protein